MIRPPVQATVTVLGAKSLSLSEKTVKNVILRVQLGHDGERVSSGLLNVKGKDWNWVVELDSLVSALDTCTILKVMIFEVSSSEKANNSCIGFVKFDLTRHRQNTPLTFPLYERVTSKMLAEETSSVQDRDAILKEKLSEKGSITLCIDRIVSGDKIPTAPSSPQNKVIGTPNAPPFRSDTAWHKSTAPFSRGDTTYSSINKEPTGSPLLRDQARPFDPTYSSLPDSPVKDIRIPGFSTACRTQSPTHSFLLSVAIFTRAAQLFIDVALFSDVLTSTVLAISVWLMIISESVAMYGSLGIALFYLMRMNKYLKVTSSDRAELTEISSSENPFAWCYPDGMCFLSKISRFNCVVHDPMHLSESTMLFEHLVQGLRSLDWSLTPLVGFLFSIAANLLPATCLMKAIHLGYFVGIPGLYYFRDVPARWQANKDRSASIQAQIAAIVSTLAQAIRVKRPHKVVSNATKASPRSMRRPSQLRGMANSAVLHSTRHPTTLSSGSVLNGHGVSSFRFNGREPKANLIQLENADNVSSGESSPLASSVGNGSMIFKGLASPTFSAGVISSPFAAQTTSRFPLSSEQAQMIIIFEFDDMNKKQKLLNRFVEVCGKIQRGRKKDPSVSLAHKSEQKAASDPDLINAILSLGLDLVAVRRSLRGYLMPSYISVEGDANTTPLHTAPILTTPHPSPSSTLSANAPFDARSLDARAGMHTCDYITMESFHNTAHFSPMEISVLQDKISKCEWILPTKVIHHPPAVETSLCVAAVLLQLTAHRTIPVFSRCSNPYFTVLVPVVAQRDSDRDVTHWPPAPSERNTCPPKLLASLFSQWELSKERRMQVENLIPLLQQNISKPGEVNHPGGKAAHQEEVAEFPLLIEANELRAKRIKKSKSRESTGNVSKS